MYKNKKIAAIVVAAGRSARMGGIDKQYAELEGEPVLARSVRIFQDNEFVDEIIAVVRPGEEERFIRSISEKYGFSKVRAAVEGGNERPVSVMNGMRALFGGAELNSYEEWIILVHDGARPFTDQDTVNSVIQGAFECGAAVPCVKLRDTVKTAEADAAGREFVSGTPKREGLRAVQTPQGFEAILLKKAYELYSSGEAGQNVTDDASLVEMCGGRVLLVPGSESNIKLTTPYDLKLHGIKCNDPPLNNTGV